jgi:hypothetical protein
MAGRGGGRGGARGEDTTGHDRRTPDTDLMASVGRNLASVYADVLCQPLPPRIADLIERLGTAAEARRTRALGDGR